MNRCRVLILCTGNACRSQMAEGLWRHLGGDAIEVHSAGSRPAGYVHPGAIDAMSEIGIDIRGHRSKSIDEFDGRRFDLVVTVCENAARECPVVPNAGERLHWPVSDPTFVDDPEQQRAAFRRVRDELKHRIQSRLEGKPT